ncbi:predicted protein [Sclerotinia sclerotiorum 1980 UF-70]|uniref:Uncharacterized protein n=1 Tax=Sclerotinia sclerotiorum (strain ATCC 18683 / 1980 / Ss-1) TaxID=665079 RepID=A7EJE0_SCLS1|nr:predicted protein [Sclerotinia sclerotiorum 1980 UF-70]EDO02956.1 predicted protein [Sclerotinia sclerotiorum 1980 UF-70]
MEGISSSSIKFNHWIMIGVKIISCRMIFASQRYSLPGPQESGSFGSNSGEQAAFTGGGRSSVKTRQNLLLTHPLRQLTYGHRRISTCSNVLRLLESWRILSHPAGRFCKESYCTCDLIDLRPKCHQIQPSSELFQILPIDKKTYHFEYPQILWSYRAELPGSLSRNIRVKHTPKVDSHYAAPVLSCLCSRRTSILFQPLIIAVFVEVLPFGDFVEGWINFRTLTYLLDWIGVKIGCIDGIATFPVPDILMKVEPKPPMTNTSNIGNFGRDRRAIVTIPMLGATFL